MNISLTSALEKYVHEKVNSGLYTSASEVIRESLRLMHIYEDLKTQRITQLNQSIEMGLAQLQAGSKLPASESHQRLKTKIENIAKDFR